MNFFRHKSHRLTQCSGCYLRKNIRIPEKPFWVFNILGVLFLWKFVVLNLF